MALRIDETGCYKDENCRRHSERQEKIDFNQRFKGTLPVVNNLAIQKGSVLLTRKFALVPDVSNMVDKKRTYSKMTDIFVKITSLKNLYIQKLIDHAQDGYLNDFTNSSKLSAKKLFDKLIFTRLDGLPFSKLGNKQFNLKERVKRCANFEAYGIVRNWLIRNENLKTILEYLISKFENDDAFVIKFLEGKRFSSQEIKEMRNALENNYFGKRQRLSTFYLNNHIYQLRYIFFRTFDFPATLLQKPTNSLQHGFSEIFLNLFNSVSFTKSVANGFVRKRKGKLINVYERELYGYLLNMYFRKIKFMTTRMAQKIIALKNRTQKLLSRKQNWITLKLLDQTEEKIKFFNRKLFSLITLFQFTTKKEFIKKRNAQIDKVKARYQEILATLTSDDLYLLINELINDEVDSVLYSDNMYTLKRIFKPNFPSIRISNINFNSFMEYAKTKIRYKIREQLKTFFMTNEIITQFIKGLMYIKKNLLQLLSMPKVRSFSLNLIENATFREEYDNLKFKLGFVKNKFITFKITDKKNRLWKFMEGFSLANPVITFKHRKLLLNLPFEKKKGNSKPFQENKFNNSSNLEMGVDLGLKHPAVLSIWDKARKREVARYFLSWKNLMDKKLVEHIGSKTAKNGKIILAKNLIWKDQARFNRYPYNIPSNIKLKLINLRSQIKLLQRKKNNYEQRLLDNGISNFRIKLKWNKIKYELSLCWNKVHDINCQIVHLVNHFIIKIAQFHGVKKIKMEDLRFAKHSKKLDSGKFMAFWQIHWFFSQVQDAIKLQCKLEGIKFQKVPARKTSQRCSRCGKLGNRKGKYFSCTECGLRLDSDLNASRNIVQYISSVNHKIIGQVHFNNPIW